MDRNTWTALIPFVLGIAMIGIHAWTERGNLMLAVGILLYSTGLYTIERLRRQRDIHALQREIDNLKSIVLLKR